MTDLVVLHDIGASGGAEWAEAFAGWPGEVLAPDLPGHNGVPPPTGGNYETGDAVYAALDLLREQPTERPLVLGVGHNGAAAQVLALGGRAAGVVLVDGLGGPWLDTDEIDRALLDMRRAILATPAAMGSSDPPAPGSNDPRATMIVGAVDRSFAVRQAEAMPVPALVLETPHTATPDSAELVTHLPDATLRRLPGGDPAEVAAAVREWWSG